MEGLASEVAKLEEYARKGFGAFVPQLAASPLCAGQLSLFDFSERKQSNHAAKIVSGAEVGSRQDTPCVVARVGDARPARARLTSTGGRDGEADGARRHVLLRTYRGGFQWASPIPPRSRILPISLEFVLAKTLYAMTRWSENASKKATEHIKKRLYARTPRENNVLKKVALTVSKMYQKSGPGPSGQGPGAVPDGVWRLLGRPCERHAARRPIRSRSGRPRNGPAATQDCAKGGQERPKSRPRAAKSGKEQQKSMFF